MNSYDITLIIIITLELCNNAIGKEQKWSQDKSRTYRCIETRVVRVSIIWIGDGQCEWTVE